MPHHAYDILVIGAGPAGANAAMAAARNGLRAGLLDEAPAAGGMVWRAPPAAFGVDGKPKGDAALGIEMRQQLAASPVTTLFGRRVWNLREGFEAYAIGPDGYELHKARTMILAPGTVERIIPFPGSTLPGIIGLGAATILLKAQAMLPGKRTVVAGAGPLLIAVAAGILEGGGELAGIVDLNGPGDWLGVLPKLLGRPDLLRKGMGWTLGIVGHRVPYFAHHTIIGADGTDSVSSVTIAPVDRNWARRPGGKTRVLTVDAVAIGHGLSPATEMTRLLGARHRFDTSFGEWVPEIAPDGATSVPGLYVAGDGAGVFGAAAAVEAGRIAGEAAARSLNAVNSSGIGPAKSVESSRRFGRAMTSLTRLRPGLVASMPAETVVCRCEDVTRGDIDAAARDGARALGQLKAWTRCGMGPCQGRMCGEAVGAIMAQNGIAREEFGQMVARPPLRPVPIAMVSGDFTYEDITLPPSLPTS